MKILHIVNRYKPAVGGANKHVKLIAEGLANRDHQVEVWTTNSLSSEDYPNIFGKREQEPPDLPKFEESEGISIRRFDVNNRFQGFIRSKSFQRRLKSVSSGDFDLVHTHGYHVTLSPLAGYYYKKKGIPHIHTAHDLKISDSYPWYSQWMKEIYDRSVGKYLIHSADRVIALTNSQIEQYTSRGISRKKIEVIPNGIDLSKFESVPEKYPDSFIQSEITDEDFVLLFVGRIAEYKRVQDVISVLSRIKNNRIKLVVVGDDFGYRSNLEELTHRHNLNNRVIFTGKVEFEELTNIYRTADLFILPSMMEGFGIVLIEAMHNRCLCLARKIPATTDLLEFEPYGFLFETKKELNQHILDINQIYSEDREEFTRLQRDAKEHIKKYKAENVVESIEELYMEVSEK